MAYPTRISRNQKWDDLKALYVLPQSRETEMGDCEYERLNDMWGDGGDTKTMMINELRFDKLQHAKLRENVVAARTYNQQIRYGEVMRSKVPEWIKGEKQDYDHEWY